MTPRTLIDNAASPVAGVRAILPRSSTVERALYKGRVDGSSPSGATNLRMEPDHEGNSSPFRDGRVAQAQSQKRSKRTTLRTLFPALCVGQERGSKSDLRTQRPRGDFPSGKAWQDRATHGGVVNPLSPFNDRRIRLAASHVEESRHRCRRGPLGNYFSAPSGWWRGAGGWAVFLVCPPVPRFDLKGAL